MSWLVTRPAPMSRVRAEFPASNLHEFARKPGKGFENNELTEISARRLDIEIPKNAYLERKNTIKQALFFSKICIFAGYAVNCPC
jgi:hypothetical protein